MSPTRPDTSTDRSLATAFSRAPGFVLKRAKRWLVSRYYSWYFGTNPDHRALSPTRAKSAVADADRILFLCWGNICRSPMAERYLRSRLDERGVDGVRLCSAGWGVYEGRPSPPDAVDAASSHDVDLGDHRSRLLSPAFTRDVDVAFVMDYNDFHALTRRFPRLADDTYFLRSVLGDASATPRIPDPHGRGPERFERAYDSIARSLDEVATAIEAGRSDQTAIRNDGA